MGTVRDRKCLSGTLFFVSANTLVLFPLLWHFILMQRWLPLPDDIVRQVAQCLDCKSIWRCMRTTKQFTHALKHNAAWKFVTFTPNMFHIERGIQTNCIGKSLQFIQSFILRVLCSPDDHGVIADAPLSFENLAWIPDAMPKLRHFELFCYCASRYLNMQDVANVTSHLFALRQLEIRGRVHDVHCLPVTFERAIELRSMYMKVTTVERTQNSSSIVDNFVIMCCDSLHNVENIDLRINGSSPSLSQLEQICTQFSTLTKPPSLSFVPSSRGKEQIVNTLKTMSSPRFSSENLEYIVNHTGEETCEGLAMLLSVCNDEIRSLRTNVHPNDWSCKLEMPICGNLQFLRFGDQSEIDVHQWPQHALQLLFNPQTCPSLLGLEIKLELPYSLLGQWYDPPAFVNYLHLQICSSKDQPPQHLQTCLRRFPSLTSLSLLVSTAAFLTSHVVNALTDLGSDQLRCSRLQHLAIRGNELVYVKKQCLSALRCIEFVDVTHGLYHGCSTRACIRNLPEQVVSIQFKCKCWSHKCMTDLITRFPQLKCIDLSYSVNIDPSKLWRQLVAAATRGQLQHLQQLTMPHLWMNSCFIANIQAFTRASTEQVYIIEEA